MKTFKALKNLKQLEWQNPIWMFKFVKDYIYWLQSWGWTGVKEAEAGRI